MPRILVTMAFVSVCGAAVEIQRKEADKLRDECLNDVVRREVELQSELEKIKDKYRKRARSELAAATKRGELKAALEWEKALAEIGGRKVNLALDATVRATWRGKRASVGHVKDGLTDVTLSGSYWYGSSSKAKPVWLRLHLGALRKIDAIRLLAPTPDGGVGHPLDYELLFKHRDVVLKKVRVLGGKHPGAAPNQTDPRGGTLWISYRAHSDIWASEVEFVCHRTAGANQAPVIYELEILGYR